MNKVILEQLGKKLSADFKRLRVSKSDRTIIRRVSLTVDPFDFHPLFYTCSLFPRFYWADRSGSFQIAALGSVYLVNSLHSNRITNAFTEIEKVLDQSHPGIRFYGGTRFDPEFSISPEWENFGVYLFFVPLIEFLSENKNLKISLHYRPADGLQKQYEILERLTTDKLLGIEREFIWVERQDEPDKYGWLRNVQKGLDLIQRNELDKIVLARKTTLRFREKIDLFSLFRKLIKNYSNSFCFYFQMNNNLCFMGITPELLFSRKGLRIQGEAIAGTRARGGNEKEDARLARELISSRKDLGEHNWVVDEVDRAFNILCHDWQKEPKTMITKQAHVQHLYTRFSGSLKKNIRDRQIMEALHPTPAVAGFPTRASVKYIGALEGFDRGWYAGPIGWISGIRTTFAVALRSSLVQMDKMFLYAGAGIVNDSEPEKEWLEIENKIRHYLEIVEEVSPSRTKM